MRLTGKYLELSVYSVRSSVQSICHLLRKRYGALRFIPFQTRRGILVFVLEGRQFIAVMFAGRQM